MAKSFKENPALHFITTANKEVSPKVTGTAPESLGGPLKLNPLYVETRSKRVQLLMQPSLHQKLKKIAESDGHSLNELVHAVLAAWVEKDLS